MSLSNFIPLIKQENLQLAQKCIPVVPVMRKI